MSESEAREFLKTLITDDSLREELNNRLDIDSDGPPDEDVVRDEMAEVVPGLAVEYGYEFTAEEGFEALDTVRDRMTSDELTDVELEQVAGGKGETLVDGFVSIVSTASFDAFCGNEEDKHRESDGSCKW